MTQTTCRACNYVVIMPEDADHQVLVCPQCGYCLGVPRPWDRDQVDEACLTAMVRPGEPFQSFAGQRKASHRTYTVCALVATPLGVLALHWAFQDQPVFWRLILGVGAFWLLSCGLILFIAALIKQKGEGRASVVPVPPEPPRGFFDLGRPICVLQEEPSFAAVLVTVVIEIAFALACIVLTVGALLALRDGVLSSKLFLLVLLAPFLSGLLVFHAVRLVFFPLRVWLFAEGLVRAKGTHISIQRWDRIEAVSVQALHAYTSTHYVMTVEGWNGQRLEFGKGIVDLSSQDLERLVNVVQSYANLVLLVAEQKLQKGGVVELGPLQLSQQGIGHFGKFLPWKEVGDIRIDETRIAVFQKDQCWCNVETATIPNHALFQSLAERYFGPVQDALVATSRV